MTRDEFQQLYEQGPDAVYAYIVELQAAVERLTARVETLEARLNKDSHNSSKPPSSDGLARRTPKPKSLRGRSGLSPGGQPGHQGRTLKAVDKPDQSVLHRPETCTQCSASLEGAEVVSTRRRQVFDLPSQLRLQVTEHQAVCLACPRCHTLSQAEFPEGVEQPVQYGPEVLGLSVYLSAYHLLPLARVHELLADVFKQAPCQGTILEAIERAFERLAPVEAAIREALQKSKVLHFDETGVRVAKKLHWVHVLSNSSLTSYTCHPRRGREAFAEIGILPTYRGISVHDALHSYLCSDYPCQHSLCNAHLLRELQGLWENFHQSWTQHLCSVLHYLRRAKEKAQAAGETALPPDLLERCQRLYRKIIDRAIAQNPPPPPTGKRGRRAKGEVLSVLERLKTYEEAVLRFALDFLAPFDNNQAERDVRMVKVQQKISGCFRTPEGAEQFCRIRGYLSTMRKQGHNLLQAISSVFTARPVYPHLLPV